MRFRKYGSKNLKVRYLIKKFPTIKINLSQKNPIKMSYLEIIVSSQLHQNFK